MSEKNMLLLSALVIYLKSIAQRYLISPGRGDIEIGVGITHWFASPLPPNRACGSPAHGSPVGGYTSTRINYLLIGCN